MAIFKTPEKGDCRLTRGQKKWLRFKSNIIWLNRKTFKPNIICVLIGKLLSLDKDILSIDAIMQKLDQLDAEK